jgi:hypothetical protein
MFAKRAKRSSQQQPPPDDGSQTTQSGPEVREASTEPLERQLDEQICLVATLREALDAATFKSEVLEKSYAKQLADTREKLAATERQLADKLEVLAALDGGHAPRMPCGPAAEDSAEGGTINELIANIGWPDKREPRIPAGRANARVAEPEAPDEDMLASDLVFTRNDRESDSER